MIHNGKHYNGGQHGFIRDLEHILKQNNGISAQLMFRADEETKTLRFPFDFEFTSVFTLDGHTLHHEVHVKTAATRICGVELAFIRDLIFRLMKTTQLRIMRFGLSKRKAQSFWIVFLMVCSLEKFLSMENTQAIPLTDTLFDNDSFCLAGLRSKTIGIYEKNSERKIICDISEYPYTLLWSAPTKPMRFICIEPWQSLPAAETDTSEWNEHAAAACIAPNESYSITLHTTFER